jgi:hypothetical protein
VRVVKEVEGRVGRRVVLLDDAGDRWILDSDLGPYGALPVRAQTSGGGSSAGAVAADRSCWRSSPVTPSTQTCLACAVPDRCDGSWPPRRPLVKPASRNE